MAHVRLTEQAQNELEAIVDYYERVGAADFAEVFEEKIIEKMRSLFQTGKCRMAGILFRVRVRWP